MSGPPKFARTASTFVTQDAEEDIEKYCHAVMATHKLTGAKRAVKVISKSKFSRASDKKLHFSELRNEIEVMRKWTI